jgi:hypothetical protein
MDKHNIIIATCGHKISDKWFKGKAGEIIIKDFDRDGDKCASYLNVCKKCLPAYKDIELEMSNIDSWLDEEEK